MSQVARSQVTRKNKAIGYGCRGRSPCLPSLWFLIVTVFLLLQHFTFSAFEEKPVSARITGMGETFSALQGGVEGIYYNPAIFEIKDEKNAIFSSYTELFGIKELKNNVFAYSRTFFLDNKIGFGIQKFGNGLYYEEERLLNLSGRFYDMLDLGINIKAIALRIESLEKYSSFGMDAGMQYAFYKNYRFGCSVKNFNRPNVIDDLPVVYRAGLSCNIIEGVIWAFDWEKEENFENNFHLGQEICLNELIFIRAGYETEPSRVSGGLGIKIKPVRIDYSIFSHPVLGETQIFSFILEW